MGLDLVELVMAVEETFGIELPDAEAEKLTTPALLTEFILTRVKTAEQSICHSRKAFYAVRRVVMKEFGTQRAQVKPDTALESLIPRPNRRAAWRRTQEMLEAESLPELLRPTWVVAVLAAVYAGGVGVCWLAGLPFWASAMAGVVPWRLAHVATRAFRTEFPASCRTAGELAQYLVGHAAKLFEPTGRVWTREEVAITIRRLTIEHLGLRPDQYDEHARFVEDLGAG